MKTVALLSQKGGSGKSTLAVHLAVIAHATGRRTVIVDLDPQRSATAWWETRTAETPEMVETTPGELRAGRRPGGWCGLVRDRHATQRGRRYRDGCSPGRPCADPNPAGDLLAIGATVDIVTATRVAAFIILNGTPASRGIGEASTTADARRALADYGTPVAPISIGLRAALAHALVDGRAVNEFDPTGKAALEMMKLWQLTEQNLWPNDRHHSAR